MLGYGSASARPCFPSGRYTRSGGFCCRANASLPSSGDGHSRSQQKNNNKKKIVIVGSGWAALGAAHHLSKQGFDITLLQEANDSGLNSTFGSPDDIGIRGFWYSYHNIFSLIDELDIKPFTSWTSSAQYSREGLEVEFPIFQDLPQLPAPLGAFFYTQFIRLPLADRLTSLPIMAAVIDFDNTDTAWRKYDSITARELFKQFGCSKRIYQDIFAPLLQVGLFAPAEQCSAAATLGMLYYYILAHQKDIDLVWCRGMVREKIFKPWMESMRNRDCEILDCQGVTNFSMNEDTGCISEVVCGKESYKADAVILAIGITTLQEIIKNSAALRTREEFLKVLNLSGIDVLTVKLQLDRKYHANELLLLKDEVIVPKVMSYMSKCIKDFENSTVVVKEIRRYPKSLTHFFPGSYKHMMRGSTSFPNLFMAGDWITNRHGSWSQEKSYVTGLESANRVVDYLEEGTFAKIIPVQEDEPHIQTLRSLNRNLNDIRAQIPLFDYFLQ
ncbi:uncharacterized protein LOC131156618 isoform X6 [Malania oleifera]|uniref:uncharacterized protein LOC131156618 isoform X6 n=1 Tax=Malania oleifera TaxID=397392 RepID=UPI0025AE541C|nr:uncharacterized protein LOC131156618 isoform X6 [Malania oleifera]